MICADLMKSDVKCVSPLTTLEDAAIPRVEAFGRKAPSPIVSSDRGGAISIPTQDPLAVREEG